MGREDWSQRSWRSRVNIGHGRPDRFVRFLDLLSVSRDRRLSESRWRCRDLNVRQAGTGNHVRRFRRRDVRTRDIVLRCVRD